MCLPLSYSFTSDFFPKGLPFSLFFRSQIADILPLTRKAVIIKCLLPVDVFYTVLNPFLLRKQFLPFPIQDHFSAGDAGRAFQAQGQVFLHLLDAHAAVFEAA